MIEIWRRTKQGIAFKCLTEKFIIFWIKHHLHYCLMERNTAAHAIKEQIISRHQRKQRWQISRQTQNLLKTKLHELNKWILHFLCSTGQALRPCTGQTPTRSHWRQSKTQLQAWYRIQKMWQSGICCICSFSWCPFHHFQMFTTDFPKSYHTNENLCRSFMLHKWEQTAQVTYHRNFNVYVTTLLLS